MTNGKWKPLWSRMVAVMAMKYQRKTVNMCERTTSVPRYTYSMTYHVHVTTTFQPSRFECGDMYTHCRNIAEYVFDGVSVCCGHSDGSRPLVMHLVYVLVQERVVKQSEAKRKSEHG